MWARHDRKPNKPAEAKFRKHLTVHRFWESDGKKGDEPMFVWDMNKDFKVIMKTIYSLLLVSFIIGIRYIF